LDALDALGSARCPVVAHLVQSGELDNLGLAKYLAVVHLARLDVLVPRPFG
jgi:hypothetical protein